MIKYIKCPRCELNYIDSEKQQYCDVCKAELEGNRLQFADLDEEEYEELDEELEQSEVCPVCGVNPIRYGEKMCENCRLQQEYEEEEDVDIEKDEEWKNYLDEDESDLTVDGEELEEELAEEFDGDDDKTDENDDEFFDEVDPLDDLGDDDDLDDDDEDDDEDDDDDDEDF